MVSDLTFEDLTIEHREHEQAIVRFSAYQKFGFQEKAFNDKSYLVRHAAYRTLGYKKQAINDKYDQIRLGVYKTFGFTEKAFMDESESVRLAAYKNLGFTENAFDDEDEDVRLEAYRALGFTQKALEDDCKVIRRDAEQYFEKCREILDIKEIKYTFTEDETSLIRMNGITVCESNIIKNKNSRCVTDFSVIIFSE